MPTAMPVGKVVDREFLGIRCRLIDLAAALDRIDRAEVSAAGEPRQDQIRHSLEILMKSSPNRAEQVQMAFSAPV
jgi:hypothetical protein